MLKQRVITAAVLIVGLVFLLFGASAQTFAVLAAVVFAIGAWEWANLAGLKTQWSRCLYAGAFLLVVASFGFGGVVSNVMTTPSESLAGVLGLACVWWLVALQLVRIYPSGAAAWSSPASQCLIGLLVLVPSWLALSYLRQMENGQWLIVYLIGIVSGADIGAYFCGRAFGKAKLAPRVSPGKSWAGFWGGLATAALIACGVGTQVTIAGLSLPALVLVSMVSALASVLGDLLESMFKRERGIKDSSSLLPGHGGVLDRIDSMTAAAPVFVMLTLLAAG